MTPLIGAALTITTVTSVVTVVLFGWDKYRAGRGGRRVPELVLHVWSLCGGWPGALIARRLFRHKTVKQPFVGILWGIISLHVLGWMTVLWWCYCSK